MWFHGGMQITSGNQGLSDRYADHREGHRCERKENIIVKVHVGKKQLKTLKRFWFLI